MLGRAVCLAGGSALRSTGKLTKVKGQWWQVVRRARDRDGHKRASDQMKFLENLKF